MSVRTPEETARLAATVRITGPYGDALPPLHVWLSEGGRARAESRATWVQDVVLACCAADLAEARAEVAALRQELQIACEALGVANAERLALRWHVKLLAEWQAAKRAEEQLLRLQTTAEFGELATAQRAWEAAAVAREAIEERMLAANLGEEVGRG